jgi:ABC-type lipoprotein export system ATPase subunit
MSVLQRTKPTTKPAETLAIELRQVVKTYQSEAGSFTALHGVDLQVRPGELVGIIGKSGSGKSTLINMVSAIDRPTSGEVLVGGTAVHQLNEGGAAIWRGRNLGIIFQFFQLLPTLTLLQNVMLPMDFLHALPRRERRERAMALLDRVGMAEQAGKLPSAISGGQQQRTAIARALANDPPILIADEPTGNLDSRMADSVFQLFVELASEGKTVVMVTHDNALARRMDRAVIVADGHIVNQYISSALADLDLDQLSSSTSKLTPLTFTAGSVIIKEGDLADRFYIVLRGRVDVTLEHPTGHHILVDNLGPGKYFGETAMLRGTRRTATVRASLDGDVEVAALDSAAFGTMIHDSSVTKEGLDRTAQERLDHLHTVE